MQYVNVTSSGLVRGSRTLLMGFHLASGNTDTVVEIVDGLDSSGDTVIKLYIPADTHEDFSIGEGIPFDVGIYFDVVSGSATGSIFVE
jgi:hypothetical protein